MKADSNLSLQILTILLDNAIAYGLEQNRNSRITVKAELTGNFIYVSIIDYGMGIPDGEKKRIFDRFYRSDQARSKKEQFGLGLSIAAELAQVQNLQLNVMDTDGGGSTFVLRFTVIKN